MSSEDHVCDKSSLPKIDSALKQELEHKDQNELKPVETCEKIRLPTEEDVFEEKKLNEFRKSVESFDVEKLKHTQTQEKVHLPSVDDILAEKQAETQ